MNQCQSRESNTSMSTTHAALNASREALAAFVRNPCHSEWDEWEDQTRRSVQRLVLNPSMNNAQLALLIAQLASQTPQACWKESAKTSFVTSRKASLSARSWGQSRRVETWSLIWRWRKSSGRAAAACNHSRHPNCARRFSCLAGSTFLRRNLRRIFCSTP